jgi:hypothetical protein
MHLACNLCRLPLKNLAHCLTAQALPDAPPNRFYAYGVVARLALLAAAIELQENDPLNA